MIYLIVTIQHRDNTLYCSCINGFLQVFDGVRALRGNSSAVHVFCAGDIRFQHPVTIFKDSKCYHRVSAYLVYVSMYFG